VKKDLPSGTHEIHAMLLGSGGQQRALAVRKLEVIAHVHSSERPRERPGGAYRL
jgi:hypothetical protein